MRPVPPLFTPQVPDGPTLSRWVRRHRPDVIVDAEEHHDHDLLVAAGWRVPEDIGVLSRARPVRRGVWAVASKTGVPSAARASITWSR